MSVSNSASRAGHGFKHTNIFTPKKRRLCTLHYVVIHGKYAPRDWNSCFPQKKNKLTFREQGFLIAYQDWLAEQSVHPLFPRFSPWIAENPYIPISAQMRGRLENFDWNGLKVCQGSGFQRLFSFHWRQILGGCQSQHIHSRTRTFEVSLYTALPLLLGRSNKIQAKHLLEFQGIQPSGIVSPIITLETAKAATCEQHQVDICIRCSYILLVIIGLKTLPRSMKHKFIQPINPQLSSSFFSDSNSIASASRARKHQQSWLRRRIQGNLLPRHPFLIFCTSNCVYILHFLTLNFRQTLEGRKQRPWAFTRCHFSTSRSSDGFAGSTKWCRPGSSRFALLYSQWKLLKIKKNAEKPVPSLATSYRESIALRSSLTMRWHKMLCTA